MIRDRAIRALNALARKIDDLTEKMLTRKRNR